MIVYNSSEDLCENNPRKEAKKVVNAMLGLTRNCPYRKPLISCENLRKIINLPKSRIKIITSETIVKSPISIHLVVDHDTGRSCLEVEFQVINRVKMFDM